MKLVADIGATNARFALAENTDLQARVTLATRDFGDGTELVRAGFDALGAPLIDGAGLSAAGPVRGDIVAMTNANLQLDARALARRLECPTLLLNDFEAVAWGLPMVRELRPIGSTSSAAHAESDGGDVRLALGPGSGFGVAACLPTQAGWQAMRSEAGHAALAPSSPLEREILNVLAQQHGEACWETVLCGPGLVRLHGALAQVWGGARALDDPAQIVAAGVSAEDALCHQTMDVFCGLLGGAASALALTFYAQGGVFLAGGILPRFADFLALSGFRRRFEENATYHDWLTCVPTHLVVDDALALRGAAAAIAHKLSFP
ncbi:MAG: ROK family protein [Pseudomonadaceae bacterium]|nr:ROK family protein [Pseudomonadaceae bacterium]